jgi:hypothetical protein
MLLTLRPEPTTSPVTPVPSSPATVSATAQAPAAAPPSPTKPAGLRSDRFALIVWLVCVGLMSFLLMKDLVVALFSW